MGITTLLQRAALRLMLLLPRPIRRLIAGGHASVDEIKRISRCGMGPCQGKTCGQIVMRELAAHAVASPEELKPATCRPPVKPVRLDFFLKEAEDEGHA